MLNGKIAWHLRFEIGHLESVRQDVYFWHFGQ